MSDQLFAYRDRPLAFVEEVLHGRPWTKQKEILHALRDHPRVTVRSAHGVGKSWLAASAVLWYLYTRDNVVVLTTAPTLRQVKEILWREIRRLHGIANRAPARLAAAGLESRILPSLRFTAPDPHPESSTRPGSPARHRSEGWGEVHSSTQEPLLPGRLTETSLRVSDSRFALGLTTDEPDRFQGFHAPHLMVVVDEASGVPEGIFQAIDAVLTGKETRLLLIGNPTHPSGRFFHSHHGSPAQPSSPSLTHESASAPSRTSRLLSSILPHVHTSSRPYPPAAWSRFAISALDSPNLAGFELDDPDLLNLHLPYPGLVTASWVLNCRAEYGEDSPVYQSRVLGDFPDQSVDSLIARSFIDDAIQRALENRRSLLAPADEDEDDEDDEDDDPDPCHPPYPANPNPDRNPNPYPRLPTGFPTRRPPNDRQTTAQISACPPLHSSGGRDEDDEDVHTSTPPHLHTSGDRFVPIEMGVDVARYGGAETVVYLRRADRVIACDTWRGRSLMQTAGRVASLIRRYEPVSVKIDAVGLGAGVVDRLREQDFRQVVGVSASNRPRRPELYVSLRDEIYFALAQRFEQGAILLPNDPVLAAQLASLTYSYTSKGLLKVESKDDLRRRGIPSPDRADALALAFYAAPLPGVFRPRFLVGKPRRIWPHGRPF